MSARGAALLLASSLLFLHACQKFDVEEENPTDGQTERPMPQGTGHGTQTAPYTVRQVLDGRAEATAGDDGVWVIGYAVGSTYRSMSNAVFGPEGAYSANLLLSADSLCTQSTQCIAVELSSTAIQAALALSQNAQHFRHCVVVEGTPGRYFNRPGLRSVKSGYWLPGFDCSSISPSEWEEREEKF